MSDGEIDVVIPTQGRQTVWQSAATLVSIGGLVRRIYIVSGDRRPIAPPQEFRGSELIEFIRLPQSHFNKANLINTGIKYSTAPYILTSDADICWNRDALSLLLQHCRDQPAFAHIASVEESLPAALTMTRVRYRPEVRTDGNLCYISIVASEIDSTMRPGCGLVLGHRDNWFEVGGIKPFSGWGWEDQDFLIRAQVLGFRIASAGHVLHLTHGDDVRALSAGLTRDQSRDYNISRSIAELRENVVHGPLFKGRCREPMKIVIQNMACPR